jgi:hypothetical protein
MDERAMSIPSVAPGEYGTWTLRPEDLRRTDDVEEADDGSNTAPWSGLTVSFHLKPSTPAGQLYEARGDLGREADDDRPEWARFTRQARDRWLRENPY